MPPTKQRPSTSSIISKTAIDQASVTLQELPEKPKASWSLREAVSLLRDPITTALNRGYSYEEVTDLLADEGIEMTVSSLKRYLATARREDTPTKPRGRRGRKQVESAATNGAAKKLAEAIEEEPESTQLSPRKRRTTGRTRTASADASKPGRVAKAKPASKTTSTTRTRRRRGDSAK